MKKILKPILMCVLSALLVWAFTACSSVDKPDKYRVTFNSNGGKLENSIVSVEIGYSIELPEPTKASDSFAGWYSDKELTARVEAPYTPEENITLYAKWVPYSQTDGAFTYRYDSAAGGYTVSASEVSSYPSKIDIPETFNGTAVKKVGRFYKKPITELTIPDSVTEINSSAFSSCDNLKTLNIGKGVKKIGSLVIESDTVEKLNFSGTIAAWCSIEFDASIIDYTANGYFYINNKLLTDLVIPSSVKKISKYAFYGCNSVTSVIIPSSVTEIGFFALTCDSAAEYWCEPTSRPDGWDSSWGAKGYYDIVHWGNEWHYVNGKPTLK